LLKHRFNVGYFFLRICAANVPAIARRPSSAVLHHRYPLNTIAAVGYLGCAALTVVTGPLALPAWTVPLSLTVVSNARFSLFTLRRRGAKEAAAVLPLSALEGFAYLVGMAYSGLRIGERDS